MTLLPVEVKNRILKKMTNANIRYPNSQVFLE